MDTSEIAIFETPITEPENGLDLEKAYWTVYAYDHWYFDADCPPPSPTTLERIAAQVWSEYLPWTDAVAAEQLEIDMWICTETFFDTLAEMDLCEADELIHSTTE